MANMVMQVAPVMEPGAEKREVYLPGKGLWYDAKSGEVVKPDAAGALTVPVTMDTVPSYLRGGHILPLKVQLPSHWNRPRSISFMLHLVEAV